MNGGAWAALVVGSLLIVTGVAMMVHAREPKAPAFEPGCWLGEPSAFPQRVAYDAEYGVANDAGGWDLVRERVAGPMPPVDCTIVDADWPVPADGVYQIDWPLTDSPRAERRHTRMRPAPPVDGAP